ncbi:dienelactone hydrolase family protein [Ramlibacter sp. 2FC]|uniref:dienelactone hydrolase family protein n=1 Tax=Ramlibacter sp. 2FC TaxID=2502188 RepID=UPI0014857F2B|nr:dienelactone hydrolase family protein [Ramlibacter sp. 2FC]
MNDFEGGAAPDLSSPQKILAAVDQVEDGRVLQQVQAVVRKLQNQNAVSVGALGFCIGGS